MATSCLHSRSNAIYEEMETVSMISHKHKTIFVHIPKAAGQSVELAFLQDAGLSWEDRASFLLRPNDDPRKGPARLAHLYADEYVKYGYIDQDSFDSYYKFAVVRHPYERAISEYRFRNSWREGPLWYFLRSNNGDDLIDKNRHMVPQARFLFDGNGKCLVDKIIKFENIQDEIEPVLKDLIGPEATLPRRNVSKPSSKLFWPAKLKPAHKKKLYEMYKDDFKLLNYDPHL